MKQRQAAQGYRTLSLFTTLMLGAGLQAQAAGDTADAAAESAAAAAAAGPIAVITVNGDRAPAERLAAGALGARSDLETPFSTAQVSSAQIEDRQIKSLGTLFSGDASVASKGGTYTQSAYAVSVRGLTLDFTNGYKIDGQPFQMYGVELPLEMFESVQLLKGATGFLYGFSAPGGIINYVSKKPVEHPLFSADIGYTDSGVFSQHIDVGGRAGEDGRYGYRVNLSQEQGETYNGADLHRKAGALAVDARLRPGLTWSAQLLYQERDLQGGVPTMSLAVYPVRSALPAPVSGKRDLGAYASTYYDSTMWLASTALAWKINSDWQANVSYGHTEKRIDSAYETLYLTSQSGGYSNRLNPFYAPTLTYDSLQGMLEGSVHTGAIVHKIAAGFNYQTLDRTLNVTPSLSIFSGKTTGNLYQAPPVLVDTSNVNRQAFYTISDYTQKSVFLSDTVAFAPHRSLLAGLRYMDYENNNFAASGARTSHYHKKPLTPTMALLYQPSDTLTVYGNYVEALEDGGTVSNVYANANTVLAPLKSRQVEFGLKADHAKWGASAALFRIRRGAAYADYSSNSQGIYVQGGELRYQGLELNGRADLTRDLEATAGATWLDATYQATSPAIVGNRIESTPRFQAALGVNAKVRAVPGLSLHANASYVGAQAANSANAWSVPAVTLASAGGAYRSRLGENAVSYRLEISNLTNRSYWNSTGSNALQAGAPRTISLNARIDL